MAGKDVYWYTRDKSQQDSLADEVQAVKQREEELMLEVRVESDRRLANAASWILLSFPQLHRPAPSCAQALGLKPKSVVKPTAAMNKHELDELIR